MSRSRRISFPFTGESAGRSLKGKTSRLSLQLEHQAHRILNGFFDFDQEGDGLFAINNPVIVAKGHVHHWAHHDLLVHHYGAILDLVHP